MNAAAKQASPRRPRGWWYPYIYVGVFGVVLAVNLVFMYSAVHSFTGLETEHAYEQGLAYNHALAMAKAQEKLGWSVEAEVDSRGGHVEGLDPEADVTVSFHDKDGKPITGLSVKADFVRPTSAGHDKSMELAERGDGRYTALASLPLPGQWEMHVTAHRADLDYQFDKRIKVN